MLTGPPPSRVEFRAPRVLFVDDERLVLRSLERLVHAHHPTWEVRCAQSPLDALDALESFRADVLVSDLSMPEMDGEALLGIVRERYPSMVRMVYSAHMAVLARPDFADLAHAALLKPAQPESIITTLRNAVSRARKAPELSSASA